MRPLSRRHHFVPQLFLRRFALAPNEENPQLWALDAASGASSHTGIKNLAVVTDYYRTTAAVSGDPDQVEQLLAQIEAEAADPLRKLLAGEPLTPMERLNFAFFVCVQYSRTPRGRQRTVTAIESFASMQAEGNVLTQGEAIRRNLQEALGREATDDEVAEYQKDLVAQLRDGRIQPKATQDHAAAGVFLATPETALVMATGATWTLIRSEAPHEFVIADHSVHVHDSVRRPGHGVGLRSSPTSETTLPLDRFNCLVMQPGPPRERSVKADMALVTAVNLRSYASAEWAYFGSSAQVVQDLRKVAKRERWKVEGFRQAGSHTRLLEPTDTPGLYRVVRDDTPQGRPTRRPAHRESPAEESPSP